MYGMINIEAIPKFDIKSVIKSDTARPQDTRFLVPEKNRAAQDRAS